MKKIVALVSVIGLIIFSNFIAIETYAKFIEVCDAKISSELESHIKQIDRDESTVSEDVSLLFSDYEDMYKGFSYDTIAVDGKVFRFIENEYYDCYADFYGKAFYEKYENRESDRKIDENLYDSIKNNSGSTYITVVTKTVMDLDSLEALCEKVLAECMEYPVAMIKIKSGNIDDILSSEKIAAVYSSFASAYLSGEFMSTTEFSDVFSPTAADARALLRYAARLDSPPENPTEGKRFFFMGDCDFDGRITASDAREALRISAKLSNERHFERNVSGMFDSFWQEQ